MADNRHTKVLKLHILKPVNMDWDELGSILRTVRYRVFRLGNLAISEAYLDFHKWRIGEKSEKKQISQLNKDLREMLQKEAGKKEKVKIGFDRFSKDGALPSTIVDALSQYKLGALKARNKWSDVIRGNSALPTFRNDTSIPVRCDKKSYRRLEMVDDELQVELMVTLKPYPRVTIATGYKSLGDSHLAILSRLLDNKSQSEDGYRQRCFEIKQDNRSKKWHLLVTYDFPAITDESLNKDIVVGVDIGWSCPLYAAISNGHSRLGRRHFEALAERIKILQTQTMKRRRSIQRGGRTDISSDSARSGHGRKRKLTAIEPLEGKIERVYNTLNHQLSAAVIKFSKNHGAGTIQMENLEGLQDELTGTFLGERWRYEELQRFIKYKAEEAGIQCLKVNPRYTSRRCSECGYIHMEFTRERRDTGGEKGKVLEFVCPKCAYKSDPDYNAARNLAILDIGAVIDEQLRLQKDETGENETLASGQSRSPVESPPAGL